MFRTLWQIIKFTAAAFLICSVIAAIGAILEVIVQYWRWMVLILILSAIMYCFIIFRPREGKNGQRGNADSSGLHTHKKSFAGDLQTSIRETPQLIIETEEQLNDFVETHTLVRSFITKVVGVTFCNDDGTSRQDILSHCLRGELVYLYQHEFEGKPAYAVVSDHGQIGYLNQDLALDLAEEYSDDNVTFMATISDITGGVDGLHYGCNISLSIFEMKKSLYPKTDKAVQEAPPMPDASSWNDDIPTERLLERLSQRPFYDNHIGRCTLDGREDLPQRFASLSKFVVLDIETTGLSPQKDKIIEIAAVKFENFRVVGTFATLVDPLDTLPQRIVTLTGIAHTEVSVAPTWKAIEREFISFIGEHTLVGHNLSGFDIRFIENAVGQDIPNPIVDTLAYSRSVFPGLPSYKLSYLKHAFGICTETSHRALEDVKATFSLLAICMEQDAKEMQTFNSTKVPGEKILNIQACAPQSGHDKKEKEQKMTTNVISTHIGNDECNTLFEKRVVFTGALSIPRTEAIRLIVSYGALFRTEVSGKTDYLVVGKQDVSKTGTNRVSAKEENARMLNDLGKANIQIIDEAQFWEFLKDVPN